MSDDDFCFSLSLLFLTSTHITYATPVFVYVKIDENFCNSDRIFIGRRWTLCYQERYGLGENDRNYSATYR